MLIDIDETKEACMNDLHFLCTQMLGYKDWDSVHDDTEKFLERPSQKKAILLPRNCLKTSIITIGKSIQLLLKHPDIRILIANQVWDIARKMLFEIKEHLSGKSQLYQLFGEFQSDLWNADVITIKQRRKALKEPTISTTGIEAEQTGGHYDAIFLDDLTGLQNCQTQEQREKTKRFRRTMVNLLEPGGMLFDVGTRWHLDDTFSEIMEKEAEYYDIMTRRIIENGKHIFPKKFNKKFDPVKKVWLPAQGTCMDYIDHLKKSMTTSEFSAQYMNNPIDEENQIIKPAYFKYWDRRPERIYVAMTLDPAISEKQSADYFAIVVCGMDENYNIYILDYLKGRWKVSEQVANIFQMYSKWNPSIVGLEVVAYQAALKSWLEEKMRTMGVYFPIQELRRNTNETKEFRIKALEPFYREGKVYHASWMKDREIETELLQYPKGKHDDLIDALASQLPLLIPGDPDGVPQIPVGSWEEAFQQARRSNKPYNDFFREVANG